MTRADHHAAALSFGYCMGAVRASLDAESSLFPLMREALLNPTREFPRTRAAISSVLPGYDHGKDYTDTWLRRLVSSLPGPRRGR